MRVRFSPGTVNVKSIDATPKFFPMNRRWRLNLRTRLSEGLLGFAERVGWDWWIFSELKNIRKNQRQWAALNVGRSQVPANATIRLKSITLTHLFAAEKVPMLQKILKRFFPDIDKPWSNFDEIYRQIVGSLSSGGRMM